MTDSTESEVVKHQTKGTTMKRSTQETPEEQDEIPTTAPAFQAMMREMARKALMNLVENEIEQLCGHAWHPEGDAEHYRAGSAPSSVYIQGKREEIARPRVRMRSGEGSVETSLKTWELAKDPGEWEEAMMRAVLCGVSTRKCAGLREHEVRGESKSNLSRLWQRKASELVEELQNLDLSGYNLLALMIDAVVLSDGLTVTVALGINTEGEKRILGYRVGSSENQVVCEDLLSGLFHRGLKEPDTRSLLVVLDGSKALQSAVINQFRSPKIQRCLVHKERNIKGYLPRKHWKGLSSYFRRIRKAQGEESALEICQELESFLSNKNVQAFESYKEASTDFLTLHGLNVPNTLNVSFLSTNNIENVFKNLRRHIGRVCRWREQSSQADLWVCSGLMLAEKGFRRIHGYQEIPALISALENDHEQEKAA